MIGQEDGMFPRPFRKLEREQGAFLNETQRTLINEKFEILQEASFGFTQDRLLLFRAPQSIPCSVRSASSGPARAAH